MIDIPMNSTGAYTNSNISVVNTLKPTDTLSASNVLSLNNRRTRNSNQPSNSAPVNSGGNQRAPMPAQSNSAGNPRPAMPAQSACTSAPVQQAAPARQIVTNPIPQLMKPVQKGQKVPLDPTNSLTSVKACFGWNVTNPDCDVDVSAFMLNASGKVVGDDWFVFYGQPDSPDNSTRFHDSAPNDCEMVTVDFGKLNPSVKKIVFVLTINDAFEHNLNFGMLKDAYVRFLNPANNTELVSFKLSEYYSNVISMMIGELYEHNGSWKFNAIGNGVARDLAGLCEYYGVEVV